MEVVNNVHLCIVYPLKEYAGKKEVCLFILESELNFKELKIILKICVHLQIH